MRFSQLGRSPPWEREARGGPRKRAGPGVGPAAQIRDPPAGRHRPRASATWGFSLVSQLRPWKLSGQKQM